MYEEAAQRKLLVVLLHTELRSVRLICLSEITHIFAAINAKSKVAENAPFKNGCGG